MTLAELPIGKGARVCAIEAENRLKRRLYDMGLTPGTLVQCVKSAPMGDPIEYKLRGYTLTLRRAEAASVEVEV